MKTRILYVLPFVLGVLMMYSCGSKVKVYENADQMVAEAELNVEFISVEELHGNLDTGAVILMVDVREPNEFNPGYIPGSVNVPRGVIEFNMTNDKFWEDQFMYPPLKTDPIVVICKKGKRSILAVDAFKKMGYTNVKCLKDGFKKWEMTYPTETMKNLEESHGAGAEVGGC
jgi:rhodanese-related sulfurtransferase